MYYILECWLFQLHIYSFLHISSTIAATYFHLRSPSKFGCCTECPKICARELHRAMHPWGLIWKSASIKFRSFDKFRNDAVSRMWGMHGPYNIKLNNTLSSFRWHPTIHSHSKITHLQTASNTRSVTWCSLFSKEKPCYFVSEYQLADPGGHAVLDVGLRPLA